MSEVQTQTASLGFFDAEHEKFKIQKPYACLVPLTHAPADFEQSNIEYVDKNVTVHNIRSSSDSFKIDVHGFQLIKHSPSFDDWHNGKRVVKEYYSHIENLLKLHLGAERVHIYDITGSQFLFLSLTRLTNGT